MNQPLEEHVLDQIFREARTYSANPDPWHDDPVDDGMLRAIWDLAKMGPTTANTLPARIVWVKSEAAKARLKPALDAGNIEKTMAAPVTAIVAYDLEFYENLPRTFHDKSAKSWFEGKPAHIERTALRNGSLQGAYLIIAARALGLDCGPMSGFDNGVVDEAFFRGTSIRSNFLVNIGYGRRETLHPRNPRLEFDEVCRIE
ncbi:MAG TPA: malonic semialdehyde reductase [Candidatus Saccharimonadia bacterium]|nr:malonic semialdehyde reductase [Candidatus Saccharimonadia bacterium]